MGDIITIGDSLIITVFSMVVVFLTLLIISYLIEGLRGVTEKEDTKKEVKTEDLIEESTPVVEETDMEDEELIAVIAAAIAASEGVSIPQVRINTIKRRTKSTPTWAKAGRDEHIFNKL